MPTTSLPTLRAVAFLTAAALLPPSSCPALTLVENGQPRAALVLCEQAARIPAEAPTKGRARRRRQPPDPFADERLAAQEIQEHVRQMSGATLEIISAGDDLKGRRPILLGSAADAGLEDLIRGKGKDPASFALVVGASGASLRGLSAEGTLFAAYELLEQLGVRWFVPGEFGAVVPKTATVTLREQSTVQVPSFPARRLQAVYADQWCRRQRLGGLHFPSSHGVHLGEKADTLFKEHPEWFSLIDGQRKTRQLCVSNPQVLQRAVEATKDYFRKNPQTDIMGIGANDGRGFCECQKCKALDGNDFDPFGNYPSMTDRYVWFFNKVLEGISDEFPTKRLGFYAYSVYNRPPVKVKPDPRIVPAVALITLCRLHGMNNPVCPEKSYEKWIIRSWGKLVPEVYYRGYWFNLADPGLPFFMIRRIAQDVPEGKRLGIAGWRVESLYEWAGSTPSRYLAARLMWDHRANVDALMADFCERFFGPAARPMRRYIDLMDAAVYEADYHTGSSWDMPRVYSPQVRAEARKALDEAARLAADGLHASRVAMYRKSLDYLDAFVRMLDTRAGHDYAASFKALGRVNAIREELWAHDPPLMNRHAKSYLQRFFSGATEQGYARTTGGNEPVAGLKDEWLFQIDPQRIGEDLGWWRPETVGGGWQTIRTVTSTWSSQGLRYYKGLTWYRQTVTIPPRFKGKRIFLWFGAIDELAKVWVNGRVVGISPRITFKPFELDATEAVRAGEPNVVVVCVRNEQLNEIGTGGIMGPVMFYAPAAGKDAKLQNARPLAKTFPEY